jgi:thiopeptide-type bacteriocin biosynthesis protein
MFLRYSDPDPHIRFRVHSNPTIITQTVIPRLSQWSTALVRADVLRAFSFETYEREVERYGGVAGVAIAEQIHHADAQLVLDLLHIDRKRAIDSDLIEIAVLSTHDLLRIFLPDSKTRIDWCAKLGASRRSVAEEYRQRERRLLSLLDGTGSDGLPLAHLLQRRRAVLEHASKALEELERQGCLERTIPELLRSYLHLHCNRLLGRDRDAERRAVALLFCVSRALLHRAIDPTVDRARLP